MIKCRNCGKDISDYAIVCPNCGLKVNSNELVSNNTQKKKVEVKKYTKQEKIILLIMVVVIVLAGFIFLSAQNARNVLIGKDVWGLGAILFEKQVLDGNISSIMLPYLVSALFVMGGIIGIVILLVKHKKK